ncbi:hypothetical protein [Rubrivirga sp.]|uniref:hypothetical protein n=1 Tax=Rubrivirga sp. TaxID=1885344 RepID=UPI003C719AF2
MRHLIILLAFVSASVFAQGQNNYGSIYSLYGLGERIEFGSSQASMLGHAGAGLRSSSYVNLSNPALWADQTVTTFSAGASLATVRGADAISADESIGTSGDVSVVHLGIPIIPGRLGAVVAYRPYSRVNYRAAIQDSLSIEGTMTPFTLNQEGAGGLQQLTAGLGGRIGPVQLGVSADALLGTEEQLQRTNFNDPSFLETRQSQVTKLRGVTATFGGAATATAIATEDDALTFGASVMLPITLDGTRTVTLGESLDRDTLRAPDGSLSLDGDLDVPVSVRAGLSYRSGLRWMATVDGLYEPWSSFESTFPVGGFDAANGLDVLSDRFRIGGGIEIVPAGRERRASALQRSSYRLGGYAERGLYAPDESDIMTLALTGGISLPSRITGARFDLGLEAGTRGSTTGVLVRDSFLKGTLTINFGERWFIQRRFN